MNAKIIYRTDTLFVKVAAQNDEQYEIGWEQLWLGDLLHDATTGERMQVVGYDSDRGSYAPDEIVMVFENDADFVSASYEQAIEHRLHDTMQIVGWNTAQ